MVPICTSQVETTVIQNPAINKITPSLAGPLLSVKAYPDEHTFSLPTRPLSRHKRKGHNNSYISLTRSYEQNQKQS